MDDSGVEAFDLLHAIQPSNPLFYSTGMWFLAPTSAVILPLHEELVLLREWVKDLKATDYLFPKLATRKTWLMVKKDPGRVFFN